MQYSFKSLSSQQQDRLWLVGVITIAASLFFIFLGNLPLLSFNEARRALAIDGMFDTGNWLIPYRNGDIYIDKPPFVYWLGAISASLFGVCNEWTLRLPSACIALALVISVFKFVQHYFDRPTAVLAGLVLMANVNFSQFARSAEIEMTLTALITWSILFALRFRFDGAYTRDAIVSYGFLGVGLLTKGPLCFLFVTVPMLLYAIWRKDRILKRYMLHPYGWLLTLVIGSSWYLAVIHELGWAQFQHIIASDIVDKVTKENSGHWFDYIVWIFTDFLPFSLVASVFIRSAHRPWKSSQLASPLLIMIGVPFILFSLFSAHNSKYLLPLYPLLAIVIAVNLRYIYLTLSTRWQTLWRGGMMLILCAYLVYFSIGEALLLKPRYSGLTTLAKWHKRYSDLPWYGFGKVDERAIYYAGGRLLHWLPNRESSSLPNDYVLVAEIKRPDDLPAGSCDIAQIKPYLKKDRSLYLIGHGQACGQ